MSSAKIFIAADESAVVADLRSRLIGLGYTILATAGSQDEIIQLAARLQPDLVLVDINLDGPENSIQIAGQLRALAGVAVIFFGAQPASQSLAAQSEDFDNHVVDPENEYELDLNIAASLYRHGRDGRLRQSEEKYHNLAEVSPDGIIQADLQGRILQANRLALQMLGVGSLEELQSGGLTCFDFMSAPAWLHAQPSLLDGLLQASPRRTELTLARRDGSTLPLEANLALLRDSEGEPHAFLMLWRDLSARKRDEARLRSLSQALAQSEDSIVITDLEGRIEYANPQFTQVTGYSLEEVRGQTPRVLKSGAQSPEFYKHLWQTIKSGHSWRGELHNRRKDGSLYWEDASIAPVFADDGTIINFIGIKREITERKQLEQAMRIKDSAISSSINAIALADMSGRLSYVNPAFVRLWGYLSADEILGRSVAAFWQEDAPIGALILTILQGDTWQGELYAKKRDGTYITVEVSAHLVLDEAGNPLCLMASFVDITARKKAEAAEKEEHRLAEALRRSAEALGSTLKLGEVLELIIDNAGQVIPNDSISIMLLDGENLKVVGHRGYTERGLKEYIEKTPFKLDAFPSLIRMIETRQPCIIPYVYHDASGWSPRSGVEYIQSYAGVPICRGERVLGFLNLDSATPNHYTEAHASLLQAFASQAAVAIENARLYEKDHYLSITDGLTGLYNSRYFFELARLEFERFHRYPGHLSVVMVDVDYFKRVNDSFGHLVGDDVLRELARRLRDSLRMVDVAARYGGEEFIILLAQTGLEEACLAAERIRKAVGGTPFDVPGSQPVSVTISLGVATLNSDHQDLNMLIKSADDALYLAKNSGRNQYAVWQVQAQG